MSAPMRLCLAGPTASGKTRLALKLADYFSMDIISVDSVMIYRQLDIGSAKPDKKTRSRIPHHLVDICSVNENYSAGRFCKDASLLLQSLDAQKKISLLTGGTLLYFKAFQQGLSDLPEKNDALRKEINQKANRLGWAGVHKILEAVDPETAKKLHPHDQQRIQRALEIYEITGKPLSQLLKSSAIFNVSEKNKINFLTFVLMPSDKDALRKNIYQRFWGMLEQGLLAEVQNILAMYDTFNPDSKQLTNDALPGLRSVGYRQVVDYLQAGDTQLSAKHKMIEKAIVATYQLAKRQMTWIRNPRHWAGEVISLDSAALSFDKIFDRVAFSLQPLLK